MTDTGHLFPATPSHRKAAAIRRKHLALGAAISLLGATTPLLAQQLNPAVAFSETTVGQMSSSVPVAVTVNSGAAVDSVRVLTMGVAATANQSQDFVSEGAYSCAANVCTQPVAFVPLAPGVRTGAVEFLSNGAVVGTRLLFGSGVGPLAQILPGNINTLVGSTRTIYEGDGTPGLRAALSLPSGQVIDTAGNLYISDSGNNLIRKINISSTSNLISTVAGTTVPGDSNDGGPANTAQVNGPSDLALDGAGNLYIADTNNQAIRRYDPVSGILSTVVGTLGRSGYSANGVAAASALLSAPRGVVLDGSGNMYIADSGNGVVRYVDAATGTVSTIAGKGTAATAGGVDLRSPYSIALAPDGTSLYIADPGQSCVFLLRNGALQLIAGTPGSTAYNGDGMPAAQATLNGPEYVLTDPAGNLYIADFGNDRVRKVQVALQTDGSRLATGSISTVASIGFGSFSGDGFTATQAEMQGPRSLAMDSQGNLYVSDFYNNRVRTVLASVASLPFEPMKVGKISTASYTEQLSNIGYPGAAGSSGGLNLQAPQLDQARLDPSVMTPAGLTACAAGELAVGQTCGLGVEFAPTQVLSPDTGSVSLHSDAPNAPVTLALSGNVLSVEPTGTTVLSSTGSKAAQLGDPVTFTATVVLTNTNDGAAAPTGTVDFSDKAADGTTRDLGTVTLATNGTASLTVPFGQQASLTLGSHVITATYSGDDNDASSSGTVTVLVEQSTTITVTSPSKSIVVTQPVQLTATVMGKNASGGMVPATGYVVFYDNGSVIGNNDPNATAQLNASGSATYTTSTLAIGPHAITVVYKGDGTNAPNTSAAYTQTIIQATPAITVSNSCAQTNCAEVFAGTNLTFSANVSSSNGGPVPTGTVNFLSGSTALANNVPLVAGTAGAAASFSTANLAPGTYWVVARYNGDTDTAAANSASPLQVKVDQLTTTTTLTSSAAQPLSETSFTLKAAVAIGSGLQPDGTLTGTVTFLDGNTVLGTPSLGADGTVSLQVKLTAGPHTLVAQFSGGSGSNYAPSSNSIATSVAQSQPTVTISSNASGNVIAGAPVQLSAQVTTGGTAATGTIVFKDAATGISYGPASVLNGAATINATFTPGSHSVVANYNGDSNYAAAASSALSLTAIQATTHLAYLAAPVSVAAGTPVTLTVQMSSNAALPSAAPLAVLDNGVALSPALTINTNGTASWSGLLGVGTHVLDVAYAGDTDNAPSTSPSASIQVTPAATNIGLSSSANPALLHGAVTLSAIVTSPDSGITGLVTFTDGGTTIGTASVVNGTAQFTTSLLSLGKHSLSASYGGDTSHLASATRTALVEDVLDTSSMALSSSVNPGIAGTPISFTAQITGTVTNGPAATGTITFRDGSTTLGTANLGAAGSAQFSALQLAPGTHTITATYAGDTNYQPASAQWTEVVKEATTTVALTSSANAVVYQSPLTLSVTVTGNGSTPGGTVTFQDGPSALGQARLTAGTATLTVSTLLPGSHVLTAVYSGDGADSAATSAAVNVQVQQTTQTTLGVSVNPALTMTSVALTANVANARVVGNATGQVTFLDGATVLGTAPLNSGGTAIYTAANLPAGQHALVAKYSGDVANLPGTSSGVNLVVNLRPTSDAVTQTAPANGQVSIVSVLEWSGPVVPTGITTFRNGNTVLGTSRLDATGTATLSIALNDLPSDIVASYSGDAVYAASDSPATKLNGTPTQFTIAMTPTSISLKQKQNATATITLHSLQGFSDTMSLGCLGLPYGATCTFDKDQVTLAPDGTATVHVTIDTGSPLTAGGSATAQSRAPESGAGGALACAIPGAALLGLVLLRGRKHRSIRPLLMVLLLAGIAAQLTGCGTITMNGTPPGTYTLQVSASGQQSGVALEQNVTLTVTQ